MPTDIIHPAGPLPWFSGAEVRNTFVMEMVGVTAQSNFFR